MKNLDLMSALFDVSTQPRYTCANMLRTAIDNKIYDKVWDFHNTIVVLIRGSVCSLVYDSIMDAK